MDTDPNSFIESFKHFLTQAERELPLHTSIVSLLLQIEEAPGSVYLRWDADRIFTDEQAEERKNSSLLALRIVDFLLSPQNEKRKNILGIELWGLDLTDRKFWDLSRLRLEGAFVIRNSILKDTIVQLDGSSIGGIDFRGSHICQLDAKDSEIKGPALFDKLSFRDKKVAAKPFIAERGVNIENTVIHGLLTFEGAQLQGATSAITPDQKYPELSLNARAIQCHNSVLISNGFMAKGQTVLNDARIKGNLDARNGKFHAYTPDTQNVTALSVKRGKIGGSIFFGDKRGGDKEKFSFYSYGCINLVHTEVDGMVDLRKAYIAPVNKDYIRDVSGGSDQGKFFRIDYGVSVYARGLSVAKAFVLDGAELAGAVWLDGAKIDGLFRIRGGRIEGIRHVLKSQTRIGEAETSYIDYVWSVEARKSCLYSEGAQFGKSVILQDSVFKGSINLSNCSVGGTCRLLDITAESKVQGFDGTEYLIQKKSSSTTTSQIRGIKSCIDFKGTKVLESLEISGSTLSGLVELDSLRVGGDFLIGARSESKPTILDGKLPDLELAKPATEEDERQLQIIKGLDGFRKVNEIEKINLRELDPDFADFSNKPVFSLFAENISIAGSATVGTFFRDTKNAKPALIASGAITFRDAEFGGSVYVRGEFTGWDTEEATMSFRSCKIAGSLVIGNSLFIKYAGLAPLATPLGTGIKETEGRIYDRTQQALEFGGARISGDLFASYSDNPKSRTVEVRGALSLRGCRVDGHFDCRGFILRPSIKVDESRTVTMDASHLRVRRRLTWGPKNQPTGKVSLEDAQVEVLDDNIDCWPHRDKLTLKRFRYSQLQLRTWEPKKDTSAEDTPTEDTPTEDTPTEDTPTEDTPTEDTPAEEKSDTTDPEKQRGQHSAEWMGSLNKRLENIRPTVDASLFGAETALRHADPSSKQGRWYRGLAVVTCGLGRLFINYPKAITLLVGSIVTVWFAGCISLEKAMLPLSITTCLFIFLIIAGLIEMLWTWRLKKNGASDGAEQSFNFLLDYPFSRTKSARKIFEKEFDPGSYDTLADAYRTAGLEEAALIVKIRKHQDRFFWGAPRFWPRVGEAGLAFFGYGYMPWLAIAYLIIFVLAGWGYFSHTQHQMWPSRPAFFVTDPKATPPEQTVFDLDLLAKGESAPLDSDTFFSLKNTDTFFSFKGTGHGKAQTKAEDKSYSEPGQLNSNLTIAKVYKARKDLTSDKSHLAFYDSEVLPPGYPKFKPLVYTLDVFVPLVDFHQEEYFLPLAESGKPAFWLLKVFGWIISTFTVASLSRQIRK